MKLLLSHTSALQYWRAVGHFPDREAALRHLAHQHEESLARTRTELPHEQHASKHCQTLHSTIGQLSFGEMGYASTAEAVSMLCHQGFAFLSIPTHILVSSPSDRIQSPLFSSHIRTPALPNGSTVFATQDIAVCSPELCFIQVATVLSFPKLIELGYEFCGTYSLRISHSGFQERQPLTTTRKIAAFLGAAKGMRGSDRARRALRYIADGSASPMETIVAMLLCLPQQLGGYGFPLPVLNRKTDMGNLAHIPTVKDYYRCDLYWPNQKVSIEYDSKKYHAKEPKRALDANRANALSLRGVTTISITPYQVFRYDLFESTAMMLAKSLGRRMKKGRTDWTPKRMELRRELVEPLREFSKNHPSG